MNSFGTIVLLLIIAIGDAIYLRRRQRWISATTVPRDAHTEGYQQRKVSFDPNYCNRRRLLRWIRRHRGQYWGGEMYLEHQDQSMTILAPPLTPRAFLDQLAWWIEAGAGPDPGDYDWQRSPQPQSGPTATVEAGASGSSPSGQVRVLLRDVSIISDEEAVSRAALCLLEMDRAAPLGHWCRTLRITRTPNRLVIGLDQRAPQSYCQALTDWITTGEGSPPDPLDCQWANGRQG